MKESNHSAFARMDREEQEVAERRERIEAARRTSGPPASQVQPSGTGTLLRIIGLPLAAIATFFASASGPGVTKTALPILIGLVAAIYFLPTIEASLRKHPNLLSIGLVNLFLGWTLLGWVVAIAWACKKVEVAPAPPVRDDPVKVAPSIVSAPPAQPQSLSVADELQKLVVLRDEGVLTEEEFGVQKARVLAGS